ncbi:MAG: hypothetical protein H0Z37_07630 [Firmicutes bacterium]|nr:hypothetical protein [Bacillota bacterium]
MAMRTGLSIPQVRYYAALYGDFLGASRSAAGDWRFTRGHLPFFRALAEGRGPAAALQAVLGDREPAPAEETVDGTGPAGPPGGERGDSALEERMDELFLQMQDLYEETKQVQILLTRVIELLQTGQREPPPAVGPVGQPETPEPLSHPQPAFELPGPDTAVQLPKPPPGPELNTLADPQQDPLPPADRLAGRNP